MLPDSGRRLASPQLALRPVRAEVLEPVGKGQWWIRQRHGARCMERAFECLGIIAPRAWVAHHHLEHRDARVPGDQWPKGGTEGQFDMGPEPGSAASRTTGRRR